MDINSIKPISYIKAHAAEVLEDLTSKQSAVGITQHGEVKAVMMSAIEYQRIQDTLAFLKLVALGDEDVRAGHTRPASEFLIELKSKLKTSR